MKTILLIMLAIGISGLLVPPAFSVTEELIHGSSSIELLPSEINPGKPTSFEIKFQYTEGPYALDNFIPVIEVSPASAKQYITIDVNPTGVTKRQILRILATLTVDPQIEHEKIFLSISFSGNHFSSRSDAIYKSAWSESVILNISSEKLPSTELPGSQDYEFETMSGARCDGETSLCYGTFANGTTIPIQCDYPHRCGVISFDDYDVPYLSPFKQLNSGISYNDIQCQDDKVLVLKQGRTFPACVNPETVQKLFQRNWALNEVQVIDIEIEEQESKLIKVIGVVNRFDTFEGIEYQFIPLRKELPRISHSGFNTVNLFATDNTIHQFIRNIDGSLVRVHGSFLFENGEYWRYLSGFPIIPVEKLEVISEKEHLNYSIDGAELISITKIPDENTLNIVLGDTLGGSLEISIPRDLIDAKMGEKIDDQFFVFVDQTEVPYTEIVDENTRILTIPFEEGAQVIEIIGVVPL